MLNQILKEEIKKTQAIILNKLNNLIPEDENKLTKAIRYSVLNTGKKLRPLLIITVTNLFNNTDKDDLITIASAIEMIHTFSLIHDDLPGMDNDDYRRDKLTCHKKFTEYNAILAGDSLIPLAFETILEKTNTLNYEEKCKIILVISKAIGYKGMCLGQSLDIEIEKSNKSKSGEYAELINTYKTGYLFRSCIEIGCILGKANKKEKEILIDYSLNFGKAFQLADDLDDNEINEKDIEKIKKTVDKLVKNCLNDLVKLKNNKNEKNINILKAMSKLCLKE